MVTPASNLSPNDLFLVLARHKAKAFLFLLFAVAAAVVGTVLFPRAYRSEGRLLLRLGWENARPDPVTTLGQSAAVANVTQIREFEINSVVAILTSRAIIEKVVDAIGPSVILGQSEPAPPADDRVVGRKAESGGPTGTAALADSGESAMLAEAGEPDPRYKAVKVVSRISTWTLSSSPT